MSNAEPRDSSLESGITIPDTIEGVYDTSDAAHLLAIRNLQSVSDLVVHTNDRRANDAYIPVIPTSLRSEIGFVLPIASSVTHEMHKIGASEYSNLWSQGPLLEQLTEKEYRAVFSVAQVESRFMPNIERAVLWVTAFATKEGFTEMRIHSNSVLPHEWESFRRFCEQRMQEQQVVAEVVTASQVATKSRRWFKRRR